MCNDAADSTQKENSELCVCLRFFSVTLCFFVSFWCACAERLSFSAVILHQSVAPLCLFVGFCVLGVIFNFYVSFCVCLDSAYISHWFASFCLVCRPLLSFCVSFFTCLSLYVRHVSILCLFVFFVLILVNHSSLVVDLPVVSCYWFASFLTIFVSLILLQLLVVVFTLTASLTFLHSWWFGNTRAACAETNTPVTELCLSIPDWKNPAAVTCFPVTTEKVF